MIRGGTFGGQAAGLRERLARFAGEPGEAEREEVVRAVQGIRDQLELVERLLASASKGL